LSRVNKYRGMMDILSELLTAMQTLHKKTPIMYRCSLSWSQIHLYLTYMLEHGWISNKDGEYWLTVKGETFRHAIYEAFN